MPTQKFDTEILRNSGEFVIILSDFETHTQPMTQALCDKVEIDVGNGGWWQLGNVSDQLGNVSDQLGNVVTKLLTCSL